MNHLRSKTFALFAKPHHANNHLLVEGIARFAQAHPHYRFKLITPEMLPKTRVKGLFDGIICQIRNRTLDALADEAGLPLVDVRNSQASGRASVVDSDNRAVGALAADYFLGRRFTNFAFFGYRGTPYSVQRKEGFIRRLAQAGRAAAAYEADTTRWPSSKSWSLPGFDESSIRDGAQLQRFLRKLPKSTAVFCCHDPRAIAVLETCREAGLAIPQDVAVLGVDNDSIYGAFSQPRLSSVDPATEEIGYRAAQEMAEQAETAPSRRRRHVILIPPKEVVTRESTECYPLDPGWLSDALVFIRRNATKGISAADVFAALGKSHTLVQEAFRTVLRSSVQREIIAVRMEEAKRLLSDGDRPVSEVARACGFSSLHYFSQAFTSHTGSSPSEYRAADKRMTVAKRNPRQGFSSASLRK